MRRKRDTEVMVVALRLPARINLPSDVSEFCSNRENGVVNAPWGAASGDAGASSPLEAAVSAAADSLEEVLDAAEGAAASIVEEAEAEAEQRIREAEVRANRVLEEAQAEGERRGDPAHRQAGSLPGWRLRAVQDLVGEVAQRAELALHEVEGLRDAAVAAKAKIEALQSDGGSRGDGVEHNPGSGENPAQRRRDEGTSGYALRAPLRERLSERLRSGGEATGSASSPGPQGDRLNPEAGREPATGLEALPAEDHSPSASRARPSAEEARLLAVHMAGAGLSDEEIARRLRMEFGTAEVDQALDVVRELEGRS